MIVMEIINFIIFLIIVYSFIKANFQNFIIKVTTYSSHFKLIIINYWFTNFYLENSFNH